MSIFSAASGFSIDFINHFLLSLTGSIITTMCAAMLVGIIHRVGEAELEDQVFNVLYLLWIIVTWLGVMGFISMGWM